MTETQKVQIAIKDLPKYERWEQITRILKDRRDELAAKVRYNTGMDEKIYSETDYAKLEVRVINRLLKLPEFSVEVDEVLTAEEVLQKETDGLDVGDVDDLFKTHD